MTTFIDSPVHGLSGTALVPMSDGSTDGDTALAHAFLDASSANPCADLIALNERVYLATAGVGERIDARDHRELRRWASTCHADGSVVVRVDGRRPVSASMRPVRSENSVVGILIEIPLAATPATVVDQYAAMVEDLVLGQSEVAADLRSTLSFSMIRRGTTIITGETGTGKKTIGRYLLERDNGHGDVAQLDARELPGSQLLSDVERALRDDRKLLLIHLDEAPEQVRSEVIRTLAAQPADRRAVVTAMVAPSPESHREAFSFVDIPPLRERLEDLPTIAADILAHLPGRTKTLAPGVRRQLWSYHWPQNLTEVVDVLTRSSQVAPTAVIDEACVRLPNGERSYLGAKQRDLVRAAEIVTITDALERCGGNKLAAAEMLGISRSTLYRKAQTLGLEP